MRKPLMLIRLSMLKPLHVGWVVEFYNEMSSAKGKKSSNLGGEQLEIADAICLGSKPPIDPFHDIERQIWYLRVEADNEGDEGDEGDESD